MSGQATTAWRRAGLSYMQYVSRATSTLRASLKEPARTKAFTSEVFSYNSATTTNGVQGAKVHVSKLAQAGKR